MHLFLERHGHDVLVTHFEFGQPLTDEEALQAGIKLGQHKIETGYEPKTPAVVNSL